MFDYDQGLDGFLEFIQKLQLTGKFTDGKGGEEQLKNVRLVRAPGIALKADVQDKAVSAGGTVTYPVTAGNCTDVPQDVRLSFAKYGWETMAAAVAPAKLELAPGASAKCEVTVRLPANGLAPGGHETQTLLATGGDGAAPAKLNFVTACDVLRPSILHTPQGWEAVREKVNRYVWAEREADKYVQTAEGWQVPPAATPEQWTGSPQHHAYVV